MPSFGYSSIRALLALIMRWYGAQTDNIVNAMHSRIGKAVSFFPLKDVMDFFRESRRSEIELRLEHLANMRLRFIVLNLIYVERFGASPFNVCFKGNEPHVDHIYPQSQLKKSLNLTTEEINHIGNYRFVGATDNIRKSAKLPGSFFGRLKAKGVNIENHLLLPEFALDPTKLRFDVAPYRDFRDRRLKKGSTSPTWLLTRNNIEARGSFCVAELGGDQPEFLYQFE